MKEFAKNVGIVLATLLLIPWAFFLTAKYFGFVMELVGK